MWRSGPLSLAYLTVAGASPVEHVEAAARAGFSHAGLRLSSPRDVPLAHDVLGKPAAIGSIRRACEATGVKPLDAEVLSIGAEYRAGDAAPLLGAAAEIGFRWVQVVFDTLGPRASDDLAETAEIAEAEGVGLALEFMRFRGLGSLSAARDILAAARASNVGLLIDALHLARSGGTAGDVAVTPAGIIALAQLCDAPGAAPGNGDLVREAREGRLMPGRGALPLRDLLDVLPDGLPLSIEVPDGAGGSAAERAELAMKETTGFLTRMERPRL